MPFSDNLYQMLNKKNKHINTNKQTHLQIGNDSSNFGSPQSIPEHSTDTNTNPVDSMPSLSLDNSLNSATSSTDTTIHQNMNTNTNTKTNENGNENTIKQTQRRRKCIVLSLGVFLCVVGLTIILSFTISIQFNYYPKCVNPRNYKIGNEKWTDIHPEMSYYNKYCRKRVVTIFNDYPCNCRQLSLTPQHPTDIPTSTLDAMLSHWTQMEGFRMSPDQNPTNATIYYNFSESSMHLEFLKIFNVEYTNIGKIDKSIGYLMPRLTIFSIWYVFFCFFVFLVLFLVFYHFYDTALLASHFLITLDTLFTRENS